MTAAQRETLEGLYLAHAVRSSADDREAADALRSALGTCGTCQHINREDDQLNREDDRHGFCAAPMGVAGFPFLHQLMPLGERCTGYTPKEGA